MQKSSYKTPTTNRGVENTENLKEYLSYKGETNNLNQFILIDWFQATILPSSFDKLDLTLSIDSILNFKRNIIYLFKQLFGILEQDLSFDYFGINGYDACYYYNDIYIMYSINRPDMGIHIKLSGQGCRDFESLGLDYYDFFIKLLNYEVNINRIDISIDDFTDRYFTLKKIKKWVTNNNVCSKFHSVLNIEKISLSDSSNLGHTFQFGSKASNVQVTFYDKLQERVGKNIIVSAGIKYWTRTEIRFRHDHAKEVIHEIIKYDYNLNLIAKSILRNYISFKEKGIDSNLSRRKEAVWWSEFLENINSLQLTNYLPENSITKKEVWLYNQTSKSNLLVLLSQLDNLQLEEHTTTLILNIFKKGYEKLSTRDLDLVNTYRKQEGLIPLTKAEICSYIDDLHEIVLKSNKNYLD